jgi:hypothetical protein
MMLKEDSNTRRHSLLAEAARKREKALQARRLAAGVARGDPAATALRDYASELERDAFALDAEAAKLASTAAPPRAANLADSDSDKRRA